MDTALDHADSAMKVANESTTESNIDQQATNDKEGDKVMSDASPVDASAKEKQLEPNSGGMEVDPENGTNVSNQANSTSASEICQNNRETEKIQDNMESEKIPDSIMHEENQASSVNAKETVSNKDPALASLSLSSSTAPVKRSMPPGGESGDPNPQQSKRSKNNATPKRKADPAVLVTRRIIQKCCATQNWPLALQAYQDAQKQDVRFEACSYYSLLSLCCSTVEELQNRVHIGTPQGGAGESKKKKNDEVKFNNPQKGTQSEKQQSTDKTTPDACTADKPDGVDKLDNNGDSAQEGKDAENAAKETPRKGALDSAADFGASSDLLPTEESTKTSDQKPPPPHQIEEISLEERKRHATQIREDMERAQIPLTESCYTALIKILCQTHDLTQAQKLLDDAEKDTGHVKVKLRLYSSLLVAFCEEGRLLDALQIWWRIVAQRINDLSLTEREYTALIQACVRTQNASVMEHVLSDVALDVSVPSQMCSQAICDWFTSCGASEAKPNDTTTLETTVDHGSEISEMLQRIRLGQKEQHPVVPFDVPSIGPVVSKLGWIVSPSCPVDSETGTLLEGCWKGHALSAVRTLLDSDETWEHMIRANETIVKQGGLEEHKSEFQGGKKGKKNRVDRPEMAQKRQEAWQAFCQHLSQLEHAPEIIIDGANVGYFQTNFEGAPKHLDYFQLDWMIQHFLESGKHILVFLHVRHIQNAPPKYQSTVESWKRSKILYETPFGMNDDWFWLHAALCSKSRALMVTNDEMRDHVFQMLAPRPYVCWKERHQVHFDFGQWIQKNGRRRREVLLQYPEKYSRRIQRIGTGDSCGIVIPMPKRGDTNRFLDGKHVENDDKAPLQELFICIRPID